MSAFTRSGLIAAAAVVALDQATKWWVVENVMQPPRVIPVTSFFNLVMGWNRGVSFGLFNNSSDINAWIFTVLALLVVAVLMVWIYRVKAMLTALAIGLVIGGALGNVVDRLRFGAVADFLDFHLAGYHWPAFNVADASITVGAVVLVLESLFGGEEKPK
ncbi:MAG: signal peptidase II [Rhodospirillales bacterium]